MDGARANEDDADSDDEGECDDEGAVDDPEGAEIPTVYSEGGDDDAALPAEGAKLARGDEANEEAEEEESLALKVFSLDLPTDEEMTAAGFLTQTRLNTLLAANYYDSATAVAH